MEDKLRMNRTQTQFIRFPSVKKLQYLGSQFKQTYCNRFTNLIRQNPEVTKITREVRRIQNLKQFKIINVPSKQQMFMSICTMQLPKKNKQENNEQQKKQSTERNQLIKKSKSLSSLISFNFNIKRKKQTPTATKPLKINYSDMYTQVNLLLNLSHKTLIKKSNINIKIRRAKVQKGNNGLLVGQVIKNRSWWKCITKANQQENSVFKSINLNLINLHWTQTAIDKLLLEYSEDTSTKAIKQIIADKQEEQLTPTFQRNFDKMLLQHNKIMQLFFTQWEKIPDKLNQWIDKFKADIIINSDNVIIYNHLYQHQELTNKKMLFYNFSIYYQSIKKNPFEKIPKTYHFTAFNWQNMINELKTSEQKNKCWIVKPGQNSNRGRGIKMFKTTKQVIDNILFYPPKGQNKTLIVQQYIKPMLYEGRKFDIRCFMLAVQIQNSIKFYFYEQGYVRTATQKFTLKKASKSIHLTNDAIQKNNPNYGQKQSGNKLSFNDIHKYILENHGYDFYESILPGFRETTRDLAMAVSDKIGTRKGINFEIYGLDFLIDQSGHPWLLEVNTNPALDLCSNLLSRIIPQMLENSMRIVLDPILPGTKGSPEYCQHFINSNKYKLIYSSYRKS